MRKLMLLTVLMLGARVAQADNGFFYLGAGVTSSSLTDTYNYAPTDLKNTAWKAFAGVRPLKWVAVEANYIDLGSGSATPFSIKQAPIPTPTAARGPPTSSACCRCRCR